LDHLTEENIISLDVIGQLRTEISDVKSEHDKQIVVFQNEKEEMRKTHENQVDTLVSQLNNLKIKLNNSKTFRKEAMEFNNKLVSMEELFYAKLYEIKELHEQVLEFTTESQTQFEKQRKAQRSFDNLKSWEPK
jgi:hypothetical protein